MCKDDCTDQLLMLPELLHTLPLACIDSNIDGIDPAEINWGNRQFSNLRIKEENDPVNTLVDNSNEIITKPLLSTVWNTLSNLTYKKNNCFTYLL